ncbi:putative membrane protein [Propionispora sp. 2/2-37]|uniref:hypothetical protein n=1 Tax=Propionispora sp. 2/2-37 TaxID=1677858 RepID=UPI0006BB96F9|nr:hypothetical protein [Propionispora sp. 2/2-37]CUH94937.1 putative membrane protein [Propionispora sp. 2/2-37]
MSFIDGYIRFFLGIPGQMAFDLAKDYQYAIYAFGFVYGIFVTMGAYNYRTILPRCSERFIAERLQHIKRPEGGISYEETEQIIADWKQMINSLPKYMCIMGKRDYWVVWPDGDEYAEKLRIDHGYIKKIHDRLQQQS